MMQVTQAKSPSLGVWFSSAHVAMAEIARNIGYQHAVLDIEHGAFDLAILERFIPLLKLLGFDVLAKVLGPERAPIQQALDFGADAVIIPHVESVQHARVVCAYAKFPMKGKRSFAGGRTVNYGAADDAWVNDQDKNAKCYPLIEDAQALEEIEQIMALDTVDGVFIGPSDLSLLRGRGAYKRDAEDFADLKHIAQVAHKAGKHWVLPAWSDSEKTFAFENNASHVVLLTEQTALVTGMQVAWDKTQQLMKHNN